MHKLVDNRGRVLYIQRHSEVVDILAGRQPVPTEKPVVKPKVVRLALLLLLFLPMLVLFLVVGEHDEQPGEVHPPTAPPPPFEPEPLPWLPV